MSRYIDADALKEYIGGVRAEYNFFDDDERPRYEAHSKAIYLLDLYLDNAPTIDAVSVVRWIPCSERLPDDDVRVLVSGEKIEDGILISQGKYVRYWSKKIKGLAWMPLPKPYGEREGER